MSLLFTLQIKGVTISGSCEVEVLSYPFYKPWKSDHWEMTSGSLKGVTATEGSYGRIHNLLRLFDLAEIQGWQEPARSGNTGPGITDAGGIVEWKVL